MDNQNPLLRARRTEIQGATWMNNKVAQATEQATKFYSCRRRLTFVSKSTMEKFQLAELQASTSYVWEAFTTSTPTVGQREHAKVGTILANIADAFLCDHDIRQPKFTAEAKCQSANLSTPLQ